MVLSSDLSSSWVRAVDVFASMPNTLFHKYIKIVLADTNEYQPHAFNGNLPKKLWQFTQRGECGRKPWECMAMGSWVGTLTDCQLACVYCSTHRAIEYFLRSDTKWFDMLQLGGQVRLHFSMHVLHFVHFIPVGQLCCECIHEQDKSFCFCLLVAVLSKRQ